MEAGWSEALVNWSVQYSRAADTDTEESRMRRALQKVSDAATTTAAETALEFHLGQN